MKVQQLSQEVKKLKAENELLLKKKEKLEKLLEILKKKKASLDFLAEHASDLMEIGEMSQFLSE